MDAVTADSMHKLQHLHRPQHGAILLLLLLPLAALALQLYPSRPHTDNRQTATHEALQLARAALIAHAVNYADRSPGRYGVLPCPDINARGVLQEGIAHGNCGGRHINSLGRLPWKTLGLKPLHDGNGECLWYAVTGAFKPAPRAHRLNADTLNGLRVHGRMIPHATPYPSAAVVIAPGAPLPGQERSSVPGSELCGGHYDAADYLEAVPAGTSPAGINNAILTGLPFAVDHFFGAGPESHSIPNDRILHLSAHEIFAAVAARNDFESSLSAPGAPDSLLHQVAECLAAYANNHPNPGNRSLPWPASALHTTGMTDDDLPGSGAVLFGHVPDRVDDSNAILSAAAGRNLITDCTAFMPPGDKAATLWQNWRDHVYYAVGDAYHPRPTAQGTPACGATANCIRYGADGTYQAALLWFAGTVQPGQERQSGAPEDYLEGRLPGYPDRSYTAYVPAAGGNDSVYCLSATVPLVAAPCP